MTQRHAGPPGKLAPRVTAILGPTNTGKTFFAIERMLARKSGMIGLPLRLLAREVHDRIVRLKGAAEVALITGEERIVPPHARIYRTRALAQQAAGAGKVRLNGNRVAKAAQAVRPGDILTLGARGEIVSLRVLALAGRRGSAEAACALYEVVPD